MYPIRPLPAPPRAPADAATTSAVPARQMVSRRYVSRSYPEPRGGVTAIPVERFEERPGVRRVFQTSETPTPQRKQTPAELAAELGIHPSTLNVWLRRTFPRSRSQHRRRWVLTEAQRQAAYAHFGRRRVKKPQDGAGPELPILAASNGPLRNGENSFVFASDGSLLGSIPSSRNRQPLQLREMTRWIPKATVAIEDRRFYEHGGLDYRGILRAAITDLQKGTFAQGGSTITQQLVRNLYIGNDQRTLERKLREACLALRLSASWSKNRILTTYLNQVYYGNHAYGIEAAAQTYFSRSARHLSLGQSALLAGLPQAPSVYDPFHRPKTALQRRNEVLRSMAASRYITPGQLRDAVRQPLGLKPGSIYTRIRQPYFFQFVEQQLVRGLGRSRVRSGGLRVKTTIDPRLQHAAEQAMKDHLRTKTDPAAALVAIDPRSGKIRAMAVDVPSGERLQFNLASQGHRQAGSAFKPFTLTAAIENGISLSSTFNGPPSLLIPDRRCETNNQPWDVHNSADESAGTMSLIDATAYSVNTIFAQLALKVGPEQVAKWARRVGIESPLLPVCSITLGTNPVSPLEMTSAYGTFAAHGIRHRPQSLELVRAANGRYLGGGGVGFRVISANTADLVTAVLQGVITHGTGTAANLGRPAAGKTGTAENYQDAWF